MGTKFQKLIICLLACFVVGLLFIQQSVVNGKGPLLVEQTYVYLPVISRPLAAPNLFAIDNADMDNLYTVSWSTVPGADFYILEEATNSTFNSPVKVYEGPATGWTTPEGKTPCTCYYRVRASGSTGPGGWSNVQPLTIYPLYVGMYAGWYADGFVRGSSNVDLGLYELVLVDELGEEADTINVYRSWEYNPDPFNYGSGYYYEQYSPTTGVKKTPTIDDPNWLWEHDWKLGYTDQFTSGQIVIIDGQRFQVTGPWDGTTSFGTAVKYWQFTNLDRFQFWVDGQWSQYVEPANASLFYDAGPSRLLLYSNILRKVYQNGVYTQDTVQYINHLDMASSIASSPAPVHPPVGERTRLLQQDTADDPRGYRSHR